MLERAAWQGEVLGVPHQASQHLGLRVGEHLVGFALLHHASAVHHCDAVADAFHHVKLVGDDHDGHAKLLVHAFQHVEHRFCGFEIERAGGLVAQEDARVGGQCACDGHALLLSAAQRLGVRVALLLQVHELQQLDDALLDVLLAPTGALQRKGNVVVDGLGIP